MYDVILIGGISYDQLGRPLGPFRLRTAAENAGYSLKAIDYAWAFDEEQLLELLGSLITSKTKILGVSAAWFDRAYDKTANRWATQNFFDKFKKLYPNIQIVTGGTKINAQPLLFNNSNWFITGFSDIAFIKLLDYLYKDNSGLKFWKVGSVKIIKGDEHYPVSNMDDLETVFKKEDDFKPFQPMPLEVSRGCIFKCAFCTHPFLGKKSYDYIRSSESLAKELARNYELFGTYRYTISDDTFNDSYEKIDMVQRAIDIAKLPAFEFVSYIRPELLITKTEMIPKLIKLGLRGCHLGIESFNSEARKVIGKGMPIQKILPAVDQLVQNGVRVHASFITGLPGEPEEDMAQTLHFLIENRNKYFHSWGFNGLGLVKGAGGGDGYSMFEKDPAAYGLTTYEIKNSMWLGWKHTSGMTSERATELATEFNKKSSAYSQFAGWTLAQAWYHGITDEQIKNETHSSVGIKKIVLKNGAERALSNFNKIVKK